MEFNDIEALVVEAKSAEAELFAVQELSDFRLALMAGGNAQVVIG